MSVSVSKGGNYDYPIIERAITIERAIKSILLFSIVMLGWEELSI